MEADQVLDQMKEALHEYRSLAKSPGWDRLVKVIREQMDQQVGMLVRQPLNSMDEVLHEQYVKGRIAGAEEVIDTVEVMLLEVEAKIKELEGENE